MTKISKKIISKYEKQELKRRMVKDNKKKKSN